MPVALVWLTGVPGAGKSAVAHELARLGVATRDADDDGYRQWRNKDTGEFAPDGEVSLDRGGHSLDLVPDRVQRLRDEFIGRVVVLAGHVPNEVECLHLFDAVVAIELDDTTLVARLTARPGRSFGKTAEVQQGILGWNAAAPAKHAAIGAFVVDGTRTIDQVAEDVAKFCESLTAS